MSHRLSGRCAVLRHGGVTAATEQGVGEPCLGCKQRKTNMHMENILENSTWRMRYCNLWCGLAKQLVVEFFCYFMVTNSTQTHTESKNEFWNWHLAMLGRVDKPTFAHTLASLVLNKSGMSRRRRFKNWMSLQAPKKGVSTQVMLMGGFGTQSSVTTIQSMIPRFLQRETCTKGCENSTSVIPLITFICREFGSTVFVQNFLFGMGVIQSSRLDSIPQRQLDAKVCSNSFVRMAVAYKSHLLPNMTWKWRCPWLQPSWHVLAAALICKLNLCMLIHSAFNGFHLECELRAANSQVQSHSREQNVQKFKVVSKCSKTLCE